MNSVDKSTFCHHVDSLMESQHETPVTSTPTAKFTTYTSSKGVMAKSFGLDENGNLIKRKPGKISKGKYEVYDCDLARLQAGFSRLGRNKAISLGVPKGTREEGRITWTADHIKRGCPDDPIARNKDNIIFKQQHTFCYLDFDGIRLSIDVALEQLGKIVPGFDEVGKLVVHSSSACLYRDGQLLKDSTSAHVYLIVKDGTDIPRFMKVLFSHLWLSGLGHIEISRAGSLLERSIIDQTVGSPERIVYEARPILNDGITQQRPESRLIPGGVLDTALLLNLTAEEQAKVDKIIAEAKDAARPDQERIKAKYVDEQSDKIACQRKMSKEDAIEVVKSRQNYILTDDDLLYFAHLKGQPVSVGEVLDNGSHYNGNPLADPLEPDYDGGSLTKAKFYNNEGNPRISSFAHGGARYSFMRYASKRANQPKKSPGEVIKELSDIMGTGGPVSDVWCQVLTTAKLTATGNEEVINYLVSQKLGSKRALKNDYKEYVESLTSEEKEDLIQARAGHRRQVQFDQLDYNRGVRETEQAVIDIPGELEYFNFGGALAYATYEQPGRKITGINDESPPAVPSIKLYNHDSLQLRVEQSVLHYKFEMDKKEKLVKKPVPTPPQIISKMLNNPVSCAPRVIGLVSHPVVAPDGRVIDQEGIDEETGLLLQYGGAKFNIPDDPTIERAREAIERIKQNLFAEFSFESYPKTPDLYLVIGIAALFTCLVRKLIDQAPGVAVTASVQGTGKTTLARIIHVISTGRDMPVTSLGCNAEEMQKIMLSLLLTSPAMIAFDNVLDGSEVNDPIIAKIITAPVFQGRILGKSQEVTINTNSLVVFTGNNITFSVDLVRRILPIRLTADIARPETRSFKHQDIVQHCLNIRSQVIHDCLLIVKTYLDAGAPLDFAGLTGSGFPQWDRLVRFPLLAVTGVDVADAFTVNRESSTEHQAMSGMVECLWDLYKTENFTSSELLRYLQGDAGEHVGETWDYLRECVSLQAPKALQNTRSLSWILKKLVGRILLDKELKYSTNSSGNKGRFQLVNHGKAVEPVEPTPCFRTQSEINKNFNSVF